MIMIYVLKMIIAAQNTLQNNIAEAVIVRIGKIHGKIFELSSETVQQSLLIIKYEFVNSISQYRTIL